MRKFFPLILVLVVVLVSVFAFAEDAIETENFEPEHKDRKSTRLNSSHQI